MTRVSIVIPCFDDGPLVAEAIESALAQDHDDCEVIVADDGSTDAETIAALLHAEQQGVRVLRRPHEGVSAARNAAIHEATGSYVLPLDADDRLGAEYARRASAVLDERPDVGLVGADTRIFGTHDGIRRATTPHPVDWLTANQLPVSTMFRRADWARVGGFPQELRWGEDWCFWVKIVAAGGGIHVLPMVGLHYRRRPGQVTNRVDWDTQERTRAHVLEAGLPIINRYPEESCRMLAGQLNQLQAIRQRRVERLRTASVRLLSRLRR